MRTASGLDFGRYARTTVRRRLRNVAARYGGDLAALGALVRTDRVALREVVSSLCVGVTSMFRDAEFFAAYRALVVPLLRGLGAIRAWHGGCATGEEVWSHAIVLEEEGICGGLRLYGTDLSADALVRAQEGTLPLDRMREYTAAYHSAGGNGEFSRHYVVRGATAVVRDDLRRQAVFGHHDLCSDPALGPFDVVFCRNVLIYFEPALQEHVHRLLAASVRPGGILALGRGEALSAGVESGYDVIDARNRLYVRRGHARAAGPGWIPRT